MSAGVVEFPPGTPLDPEDEAIPAMTADETSSKARVAIQASRMAAKLTTTKLSAPNRKKLAAKLAQYDSNGNGEIDKDEVRRIVSELVASETKSQNMRLALATLATVLVVVLLFNAAMAYGVVYLSRDTTIDGASLLVDKISGEAVHTASGEFQLAEDGTLIVRAHRFKNDTAGEARRRLLSGQSGETVVTAATLTNANGVMTAASGEVASTAALTDGNRVLTTSSGLAVQTQQAIYVTDLENEGGLEMLFSLPEPAVLAITGWTAEADDGTEADLDIVGHEIESVIFEVEDFLTPEDTATMYDTLPALEDFVMASVEVHQYKLISSHYAYSMVVVRRLRFLDSEGQGAEGAFFYQGPVLVPRGEEDLYNFNLRGNTTDNGGTNLRRHLLARKLLCDWVDIGCWIEKAANEVLQWIKNAISSVTNIIEKAVEEVKSIWRLIQSIPGHVARLPELILEELKKVEWLPTLAEDIMRPIRSVVENMLPLEGSPPGKCVPFCKLARYGGNARIFAGNEVILKETATWKMTTTLNNLQTCFQIRAFEFDASKIGQFLKDIFNEVIMPLIDGIAQALKDLLDAILKLLKDAIEGIKNAARKGKEFIEDLVDGIASVLGKRRRALLGFDSPDMAFSKEEIDAALASMLQETVSIAALRKLLELEGGGVGPQQPHAFPMHTALMGDIQTAAEDMFRHGHGAVRRGLAEGIHRRKALEWGNLLALDKLETGFAFNWEQTIQILTTGGRLKFNSGDLMSLLGDNAPSFPITEGATYMIMPGVTLEAEVLLDLQFPWDILTDGEIRAEVTLGVKDMHVALDVLSGELTASPSDFSFSRMSVESRDGTLQPADKLALHGRLEMKLLVGFQLRLCFFGHCVKLEVRGRQYLGIGFDFIGATCDAADSVDCGGGGCASFLDPNSVNYFRAELTGDVTYPESAHACIADTPPGQHFGAYGMWGTVGKPSFHGFIDFPGNLAGSLIGGGDCDAGDLDDLINQLDTELFSVTPSGYVKNESFATTCTHMDLGGADASGYTAPTVVEYIPAQTLLWSDLDITYEGCYVDPGNARAFREKRSGVTMVECINIAISTGYDRIGLQWPQGFSTKEHIECWFGDYDATNPKRPDNECRGETWPARYKGYFSRYNGSGNRNAVYRIGDIGVRYLGCWNSWPGSTEAGSFTSSIGTMEQCAERAVSNGHNRFALMAPRRFSGTQAQCWTGSVGPNVGAQLTSDYQCRSENWDPDYTGLTDGKSFAYNGGNAAHAMYRVGLSSVGYIGCFNAETRRALAFKVPVGLTMDECAATARAEGSPNFGLQYPAGYSGEKAECWHGIYDGVSERRPDAECQTENWYPRLNGEKAQFHGGASRNAIYALDPGPARYVGCFRDDGTKGFSKRMNNVNMEDCANLAIRAGSALFGLQYPQGYWGNNVECFYGDWQPKPRVANNECKREAWNPTYRGHEFKYNGNGYRNAVYQVVAPARYMGCYSDENGNAFQEKRSGLTMEQCAAATRAAGSAWFGLQNPQVHRSDLVDCWIGAFDAGKPKVSKDLECRSETWDPSAWGRVYKYHGDRQRTAVYVLTKPARFVGCYRESAAPRFSKAFSQSVRGVSMEGCAAIALGAGSDRQRYFGLRNPEGSLGYNMDCWFGDFNPDPEDMVSGINCRGEFWGPSLHGQDFMYQGSSEHVAVYEYFG